MTSSDLATTVLWDVDGTLLDVRGAGRRAFAVALTRVWGDARALDGISFAGATDLGVLAQVLDTSQLDGARLRAFFDELVVALDAELRATPARPIAGALDVTRALTRAGVPQGLLTGNEERCAHLKLGSAGFERAWFCVGAFGHEHADRDELARLAAQRSPGRHVVVGDTPKDVQAARAIGAVAVAVCTGFAPRAALEAARPDHLLDDLGALVTLLC
ncbi:MAG: HAD family hydrolase [Deltaproteobacteria bacterium]|nr:HAD family hydrolase [Deltaproteobacteria bacterium]